MFSRKTKHRILKAISLFSVVRGYNIPVIILAQYLAAIFILSPDGISASAVIFDGNLLILVLASSLAIASGYIINNFYDYEKDVINRPRKSILDRLVSQKTKLNVYFSINFFVFALSFIISWRVAFFYSCYIFLIWFYSHKLKKIVFVGNTTAAILAILPFFGILLYYVRNALFPFYYTQLEIVFLHATFLFLVLLVKEMIKDLENLKGDFASNYQTVPVLFGEKTSKKIITGMVILTVLPVYLLVEIHQVGHMDIYFYCCFIAFTFFLIKLWKSHNRSQFLSLHNLLKVVIAAGVCCIVLIKPELLPI
jgi:4-hydroxybenzoate polyprenyltransferase